MKILSKNFKALIYGLFSGQAKPTDLQDIDGSEKRRFDSTGMFHWCPSQALSACTVVSSTFFPLLSHICLPIAMLIIEKTKAKYVNHKNTTIFEFVILTKLFDIFYVIIR